MNPGPGTPSSLTDASTHSATEEHTAGSGWLNAHAPGPGRGLSQPQPLATRPEGVGFNPRTRGAWFCPVGVIRQLPVTRVPSASVRTLPNARGGRREVRGAMGDRFGICRESTEIKYGFDVSGPSRAAAATPRPPREIRNSHGVQAWVRAAGPAPSTPMGRRDSGWECFSRVSFYREVGDINAQCSTHCASSPPPPPWG